MFDLVLGWRMSFDGRIDSEAMKRAVRLLLDREPVLGCWFDEGFFGGQWLRCSDLDGSSVYSVHESTDSEADSLALHQEPFHARGPRLKVRLLRSATRDDLCLKVDHFAADGWSTKELAYILADTYGRLLQDPGFVPQPDLSPRPGVAQVWGSLTEPQRRAAQATPRMVTRWWKMGIPRGAGHGLSAVTATLQADECAALRTAVHKQDSTVNDAVVTALLCCLYDRYPTEQPVMSISADSRRFAAAPELRRVCVLATPQTVAFPIPGDGGAAATLKAVAEAIRPWKQCLWGIRLVRRNPLPHGLMRIMFSSAAKAARRAGTSLPVVMNLGAWDEDRLRFGELRPSAARVLGSTPLGAGFCPTISSYRGDLSIWMGCYSDSMDPSIVREVTEDTAEELRCLL